MCHRQQPIRFSRRGLRCNQAAHALQPARHGDPSEHPQPLEHGGGEGVRQVWGGHHLRHVVNALLSMNLTSHDVTVKKNRRAGHG